MGNTAVVLPGDSVDHPREARFNFVSAGYFEALAIPLHRGRAFTDQEVEARLPLAVISEATAKLYWPGVDPLGKTIGVTASPQAQADSSQNTARPTPIYQQYEVIGVARDVRSRWLWEKDETLIYLPLPSASLAGQYLLVRTVADPVKTMAMVRPIAATMNPALRTSVRRLEESFPLQMAPFRALALLSTVLGVLALALASIGLYGVMSFVVKRRTHEIGIRIALGARPADVVRMFLFQGLRLTAAGVACGLLLGGLISRLLAAVLIDVSPFDPLALGVVSLFLTLVAVLAVLLPARHATKVDPLRALRYE
jgi:hypothetical protein